MPDADGRGEPRLQQHAPLRGPGLHRGDGDRRDALPPRHDDPAGLGRVRGRRRGRARRAREPRRRARLARLRRRLVGRPGQRQPRQRPPWGGGDGPGAERRPRQRLRLGRHVPDGRRRPAAARGQRLRAAPELGDGRQPGRLGPLPAGGRAVQGRRAAQPHERHGRGRRDRGHDALADDRRRVRLPRDGPHGPGRRRRQPRRGGRPRRGAVRAPDARQALAAHAGPAPRAVRPGRRRERRRRDGVRRRVVAVGGVPERLDARAGVRRGLHGPAHRDGRAHAAVHGGRPVLAVGGRLRGLLGPLRRGRDQVVGPRAGRAEPDARERGPRRVRRHAVAAGAGPRRAPRPVQVLRARGLPARGRPGLQRLRRVGPGGAQRDRRRQAVPVLPDGGPQDRQHRRHVLLRGLRPEDPAAVPGRRPVDARVLRRRAARRRPPPGAALQARHVALGRRGTGHRRRGPRAAPRQPRRRRLDRLARLRPEARRLHPRRPPAHGRDLPRVDGPRQGVLRHDGPAGASRRRHARGRPHGPGAAARRLRGAGGPHLLRRHAAGPRRRLPGALQPHRGVRLGLGLPPQVRRRDDGGDRGGRRARLHGLGRRRDGHRGRARDARGHRRRRGHAHGDEEGVRRRLLGRPLPRHLRRRPRAGRRARARRRVAGAGRLPRRRGRGRLVRLRHERDGVRPDAPDVDGARVARADDGAAAVGRRGRRRQVRAGGAPAGVHRRRRARRRDGQQRLRLVRDVHGRARVARRHALHVLAAAGPGRERGRARGGDPTDSDGDARGREARAGALGRRPDLRPRGGPERLRRRRLPHDVAGRPDAADPEAGPAGARARRGRLADGAARGVGRPGERRRRARHVVRGRVRPGADLRLGRAGPRRGLGARVRVGPPRRGGRAVGHGRRDDGRALPGRLLRPQLRRPGHAGAAVRRVGRRRRGGARGALHGRRRHGHADDALLAGAGRGHGLRRPAGLHVARDLRRRAVPGRPAHAVREPLPGRRGPQALRGRREPPELRDQGGAGQRPARHGLPARRGQRVRGRDADGVAAGGADLHLRRQRRAGRRVAELGQLLAPGARRLHPDAVPAQAQQADVPGHVRVPGRRRGHGPGAAPRPRRRVGPDAAPREGRRGGLRAGVARGGHRGRRGRRDAHVRRVPADGALRRRERDVAALLGPERDRRVRERARRRAAHLRLDEPLGRRGRQGRRAGARGPHDLPGAPDGRDLGRQLVARARQLVHVRGRGRGPRRDGPRAAPAGGDGAHGRAVGHGDAHGRPRGPRRVGRAAELGRRADRLLRARVRHVAVVRLAVRRGLPAGHDAGLPELALQVPRRRAPRARRGLGGVRG